MWRIFLCVCARYLYCCKRYIVHLECVIMSVYKYKQYTVKHNSITNLVFYCFVQRHVSALVMNNLQVDHFFFSYWRYNPLWVCILQPTNGALASSRTRFLDHTQRRATVGRTPLGEWSVRRRDLYLTTRNTQNRQTSMPRWDSTPRSQQASGLRPTP